MRGETPRQQIENKCVHFNGTVNKVCKAGVAYLRVRDESGSPFTWPCFRNRTWNGKPVTCSTVCDKLEWPTPEAVDAELAHDEAQMEKYRKIGFLIQKVKREQKGKSWKGVEICPNCGGNLHMTHAALNGHVWGRCETKGCVAWLE